MNYIDVLKPISEIFEKDDYVSGIESEKIAAVSKEMSIKTFCNKWTVFTLKRDSELDETEVELIDECLNKYGLSLDMTAKEIDKYQAKARNLFGMVLSKEEEAVLNLNKKNIESKININTMGNNCCLQKTKQIIVDTKSDNFDKMFIYTLKCMKELGVGIKQAKEIVSSYFCDGDPKEKINIPIVRQRNVCHNDTEILSSLKDEFRLKDMESITNKLGYPFNYSGVVATRLVKKGYIVRIGWGRYKKVGS